MTISNLSSDIQALTSNVFLVEGAEPALIDTGSQFDIVSRLERRTETTATENGLSKVVITHAHPDHVDNVDRVRSAFDVRVLGFDGESPYVDRGLDNGETLTIGDHRYEVWHTPGHATDHLCLYSAEPSVLFSGDLIFANGGIGRTDIPGADPGDLRDSIAFVRNQVDQSLAELHPGHGPSVPSDAYRHVEAAARAAGLTGG